MKKSVTLSNGTLLEVGKKYRQSHWIKGAYIEVKCIDGEDVFGRDNIGIPCVCDVSNYWLPYTAPQEVFNWKTFLMVVQHHKSHIPYQVIIRCKSIEDAKIIHKNAISITEVEIDIKEK
ncbi:MAG: hypothetical protein RLZZ196_979 [Bacteroidota bacterium]|jgi:predicted metal-binding protein